MKEFKVRDLRKKEQYKIDDEYLNGYAKLCGIYSTAVYNSLSRHADFNTQQCWPSIEKISEQHNISKPSVIKGIKQLEKWNIIKIIKEKDNKTKRQLNNVYILLDKAEWIKKESRVNEVNTGKDKSRVNEVNEPSQLKCESRVNEVECKDNTLKDNTVECMQSQAIAIKININKFIELFKEVNPNYERLFANKTQRAAIERMVKKWGDEKMENGIKLLPQIINKPYAPIITTPVQLENKMGELINFINKEKLKVVYNTKKSRIIK